MKSKLSNVVVTKVFAPECAEGRIWSVLEFTQRYCTRTDRALTQGCPMGVNLIRRLDPVTGVELSRNGQAMPRDCSNRTGEPAVVTAERVQREFQELPLAGSGLMYQPVDSSPVINLPFIVQTSTDSQVIDTVLLGAAVRIEATPVRFRWDYGDGTEPYVTSDPNAIYPNNSYEHVYRRVETVTVSLETTWRGRFQVDGGTWRDIPGTVSTEETSPEITVTELKPVNINAN